MRLSVGLALCCLCTAVFAADPAHAAIRKDTSIPAEGLGTALQTLANTYDFQVLYKTELVQGLKTEGVSGSLTSEEALTKVLGGTGLSYKYLDVNTVTVYASAGVNAERGQGQPDAQEHSKEGSGKNSSQDFRVAQAGPGQTERDVSVDQPQKTKKTDGVLEEVVVTGSHIRGPVNSASPFETFSRVDLDQMGASTLADFTNRLPGNFSGPASENTIGDVAGGGAGNSVNGTGINLRGLGAGTTLILIDGRRLAPGNLSGNFVDISMIPLSAVERVEIIPDGASAIYGSDATGGVVNFIMRKDFEGFESRVRYGSVTDGASHEFEAAQTAGTKWSSGSAMITYEYWDRTPLDAASRSYTPTAEPFTLLPEQIRHTVFANADQTLDSGLELFASGVYGHRYERQDFSFVYTPPIAQHYSGDIASYSASIGARTKFAESQQFELSANYAASSSDIPTTNFFTGSFLSHQKADTRVFSVDPVLSGDLFATSQGTTRYAVGAQFRRETYDIADYLNSSNDFSDNRDLYAAFVELRLPLLAGGNNRPGTPILELSLADRYEHYSDFGSTNNPKFGLVWNSPIDLRLRGTYGTSFKAPDLTALNPAPSAVYGIPMTDPTVGHDVNTLVVQGGNPALQPEKARTWTLGADFDPEYIAGFHASTTYYHIHFSGQVQQGYNLVPNAYEALQYASILGPEIIQRGANPAEIASLMANPLYTDLGLLPGPTTILINYRDLNLQSTDTSGVDLKLAYHQPLESASVDYGLDVTRILKFDEQGSPGSPVLSLLNTEYNPVGWKGTAKGILNIREIKLGAFVNYVGSYHDNRTTPSTPIASWTTIDLNASYHFGDSFGAFRNSDLSLGARNIADRNPPFVTASSLPYVPVNFDGNNANALGRFIYVQLQKTF